MHVLVYVHYLCNPRAIGAVTQVSPSFSASSKIVLHVYRLSEGPVWLHHLRHHQLPTPLPGLRSRKLSASFSSEVPPCLHPLTLLLSLHKIFVHPGLPKILHYMPCCFKPAMCPFASPIGDQSQAAWTCMGLRNGTRPTNLPLTCLLLGACATSLLASQAHCTHGLHDGQAQQHHSINHSLFQHVCSSKNQVLTILSSSLREVLFWQSALQQEHADSPQHCHATHVSPFSLLLSSPNHCGCDVSGRPGLLLMDISHDVENRRIPVFNTVDDDQPPIGLQYIR